MNLPTLRKERTRKDGAASVGLSIRLASPQPGIAMKNNCTSEEEQDDNEGAIYRFTVFILVEGRRSKGWPSQDGNLAQVSATGVIALSLLGASLTTTTLLIPSLRTSREPFAIDKDPGKIQKEVGRRDFRI
jgi:hypothetical protein